MNNIYTRKISKPGTTIPADEAEEQVIRKLKRCQELVNGSVYNIPKAHIMADEAIRRYLLDAGLRKIAVEYNRVSKWYE